MCLYLGEELGVRSGAVGTSGLVSCNPICTEEEAFVGLVSEGALDLWLEVSVTRLSGAREALT